RLDRSGSGVRKRFMGNRFRRLFERVNVRFRQNRAPQFGMRRDELRKQQAAAITGAGTMLAARFALGAAAADETLVENAAQSARKQVGLDTHVEQPPDNAARGAGVQRAENEMACQGGFDADAGGLGVA